MNREGSPHLTPSLVRFWAPAPPRANFAPHVYLLCLRLLRTERRRTLFFHVDRDFVFWALCLVTSEFPPSGKTPLLFVCVGPEICTVWDPFRVAPPPVTPPPPPVVKRSQSFFFWPCCTPRCPLTAHVRGDFIGDTRQCLRHFGLFFFLSPPRVPPFLT